MKIMLKSSKNFFTNLIMINENNPFQIALKSISTLKDAIVLLSCLLKVKELNREQYFYNGNSQESFLFKFLNKKFLI